MELEKTSRLDEFIDKPKQAVWVLAGPMMVGFMVHALYNIVDAAFIGQLGPLALAAATFVIPLFFIAIGLGVGFATGVTAAVAQAIGRRDKEAAERLASNSLGIGVGIGLVFLAFGLLVGRRIMPMLGAEGVTADLAWQYFQVMCMGMPFVFLSMPIRAVLTGEGDAKTPMIVMSAATILNAILDPIFIFTLGLGIRGAAFATIIAQLFSLLSFSYIVFVKKKSFIRFRLSLLWPRWSLVKPIAVIGIPVTAAQFVMSFGMGLLNRVISEFGQTAVTGYGAASKVDLVVALPVLGLASASVSVIGMFAGAKRVDLVRSTTLYVYRWNIVIATSIGLSAFMASKLVLGLFTEDPYALEVGGSCLSYMVFAYPLMAFGMTSGRVLQGLGYGIPSLVITATRILFVGIPIAYVGVYIFDAPIELVWLSGIIGGAVANVLAFLWVRNSIWKHDPTTFAAK